jgi:AcrR family transcriptional regulator
MRMSAATDVTAGAGPTRRDRVRAATMAEIKAAALELLRSRSATDLTFADIAREVGMTAPGLYRYYKDRDDLLVALIYDAYSDLATCLHAAIADITDPREALSGLARAYRGWAVADPIQFALIFGVPIPGFDVPESAGTLECAHRAMAALESVPARAAARPEGVSPLIHRVGPAIGAALQDKRVLDVELSDDVRQAMMIAYASLHGFTCLEVFGHIGYLDDLARDELFDAQIEMCALTLGL